MGGKNAPPWRSNAITSRQKRPREEEEEEEQEQEEQEWEEEAEEMDGEEERLTGTVVRFAAKRGFGFIRPTKGGKEVFVHWAQIASTAKWPRLERDMVVEYTPGFDEDGRHAAFNVTLEGGEDVDLEDEEDERKLSSFRVTGTVKFFARGGYGFISIDKAINWPIKLPAGSDVYVGREELEVAEESLCRLEKGQQVEFNVYKAEGKEHIAAANVTEVGGEAILLEKGKGKGKGKRKGKGKGKGKGKRKGKGKYNGAERESRPPAGKGGKGKVTGVRKTIGKGDRDAGLSSRRAPPPSTPVVGKGSSSKGKDSRNGKGDRDSSSPSKGKTSQGKTSKGKTSKGKGKGC